MLFRPRFGAAAGWAAASLALLVSLVMIAEPTPAQAQEEILTCKTGGATYFPVGGLWAFSRAETYLYHHHFASSSDAGPSQTNPINFNDLVGALNGAYQRWADVDCGGGTRPNLNWADGHEAPHNMPYQTTRDIADVIVDGQYQNFKDVIYWDLDGTISSSSGSEPPVLLDPVTLAITLNVDYTQFGLRLTSDIVFNGKDYEWRVTNCSSGQCGCTKGSLNCADVFSVALHEFGHFLGLGHVSCGDAVMFPSAAIHTEETGLSFHEQQAICDLYPPKDNSALNDYWGNCSATGCPAGLECKFQAFCTQNCTLNSTDPCPDGYACGGSVGAESYCMLGVKSAPTSPGGVTCDGEALQCNNGLCIPFTQRCDGVSQCAAGEDEAGCTGTLPCYEVGFKCRDQTLAQDGVDRVGHCVVLTDRCDGVADCPAGDDEIDCSAATACGNNGWTCSDNSCIPLLWRCDGVLDCTDDETGCDQPTACPSDGFTCNNGTCLPSIRVCDHFEDCADGSDEVGCPTSTGGDCIATHWRCSDNTTCINASLRCDGITHCPDLSDEIGCVSESTLPPEEVAIDDTCLPCSTGNDCSTGLCVLPRQAGTSGTVNTTPVCTTPCTGTDPSGGTLPRGGCALGFTCESIGTGRLACIPDSGSCGSVTDTRAGLNDECFAENLPGDTTDNTYRACGPGLVCFGFRERAEGREGACVEHCTLRDTAQRCPEGTQCCYSVDALGQCQTLPSTDAETGGCFSLRKEGEACVTAEQSICEGGTTCLARTDAQGNLDARTASCYKLCDATGVGCLTDQSCVQPTGANFQICCETDGLDLSNLNTCLPNKANIRFDLGVACETSTDCASGLCFDNGGKKACSRSCDPNLTTGCPGNIDVNGNGVADGGFHCLLQADNSGRCWPAQAGVAAGQANPVSPPDRGDDAAAAPPPAPAPAPSSGSGGGSCLSATGAAPPFSALLMVLWLVRARVRRRFSRRRQ